MVKKRGQAAMEFLMTYGWALLVVLVAIGALMYFDILNPAKILPEQCILSPPLACTDWSVTTTGISLSVQNGYQSDLTGIELSSTNPACATGTNSNILAGATGIAQTLTNCVLGTAGDLFKGEVTLEYTVEGSGLTHKKIVNLKSAIGA